MLKHLHISNYALISHLDIDFNDGFSVITGETGAGKSIILGALGLVLGDRADTKSIRDGEQKCVIEAEFDINNYHLESFFELQDLDFSTDCTIRRELNSNGKSRCFVNDTPINLNALKQLGSYLIDIHSQHQNMLLAENDFQLQVIDIIANNSDLRQEYSVAYHNYLNAKHDLDFIKEQIARAKQEQDYTEFQYNQLEEAKLKSNEEVELEAEISTLSHAEEIKSQLMQSYDFLNGDNSTINLLKSVEQMFTKVGKYNSEIDELNSRLHSTIIELKDIANSVESLQNSIHFDPDMLQRYMDRLDLINSLLTKHHLDSSEQLIDLRDNLRQRLHNILSLDDQIILAEQKYNDCSALVANNAEKLSKSRFAVKNTIENELKNRLQDLGIKHAQLEIDIAKLDNYTANGADKVTFRFAANKNQQLRSINDVASGGEISRVMLCIKSMIANSTNLPTILFDEIDTGVSGEIADSMAKIMLSMSGRMQVICITHLPQIAAKGQTHYKVYKSDNEHSTETHITRLSKDERITEIATMLSGNQVTDAAIANAKQLLQFN